MKNLFILVLLVGFGLSLQGQERSQPDLSPYKYALIKKQYVFQKEENSYQINDMLKFQFEKKGFVVLYESDKIPEDLFENPCLGLKVDIVDLSNMFTFKMRYDLIDCRNTTVFTGEEVKSKIKDFKKGYQDVMRKAMVSVSALPYAYIEGVIVEVETPAVPVTPVTPVSPVEPVAEVVMTKGIEGSYFRESLELKISKTDSDLIWNVALNNGEKKGLLRSSSDPNTYWLTWEGESQTRALKVQGNKVVLDSSFGALEFIKP